MISNKNDYDFLCSNNSKFIKIAIKNNAIHTVNLQTDTGVSIDFGDGTANVDSIIISKCFKLVDIHWAKKMGAIKRLRICYTNITSLDLSKFESLEELSIIDCNKLVNIIDLPSTLKTINVHGTPIETLDVTPCTKLEMFNIETMADKFNVDISNLNSLASVSIITNSPKHDDSYIHANISNCIALRRLNIESNDIPANIQIKFCPDLTEAHINAGPSSSLAGISGCVKLKLFHLDNPNNISMDDAAIQMSKNFLTTSNTNTNESDQKLGQLQLAFTEFRQRIMNEKPGPEDIETTIQQNGNAREKQRDCQVKITLLSMPIDFKKSTKKNVSAIHQVDGGKTGLQRYLGNPTHYVVFLENRYLKRDLSPLMENIRIPARNNDGIVEWLLNIGNLRPNIFMLNKTSMLIPSVVMFISTFNPRENVILYEDQYYDLTPEHKIVVDPELMPVLEQFANQPGLPITPEQQAYFRLNLLATNQVINEANPNLGTAAEPNQPLNSIIQKYLNAVNTTNPAANQSRHPTEVTKQTNKKPSMIASTTSALMGAKGGQLSNHLTRRGPSQPTASARIEKPNHIDNHLDNNKWKSISAEDKFTPEPWKTTSHKEEFIPELWKTSPHKDDLANQSNKIEHQGKKPPLVTKEAASPSEASITDANHAKLLDEKPSNLILASDKISVNAEEVINPLSLHQEINVDATELPSGQHATITKGTTPGKSESITLPIGQPSQAKLITDKPADDLVLASGRIDTYHTAHQHELLTAAQHLGDEVKKLTDSAATRLTENDQPMDNIDHTTSMLDDSLHDMMMLSAQADLPNNADAEHQIEAATSKLNDAVNRLHAICGQLRSIPLSLNEDTHNDDEGDDGNQPGSADNKPAG